MFWGLNLCERSQTFILVLSWLNMDHILIYINWLNNELLCYKFSKIGWSWDASYCLSVCMMSVSAISIRRFKLYVNSGMEKAASASRTGNKQKIKYITCLKQHNQSYMIRQILASCCRNWDKLWLDGTLDWVQTWLFTERTTLAWVLEELT